MTAVKAITYDEIHHEIYETLIAVAREEEVTYYSEIAPLADLDMSDPSDRKEIADILFRISAYEHQLGNPMLSAVVVLKGDGFPGPGFFELGEQLGIHDRGPNDADRKSRDVAFFADELRRVHEHWRTA